MEVETLPIKYLHLMYINPLHATVFFTMPSNSTLCCKVGGVGYALLIVWAWALKSKLERNFGSSWARGSCFRIELKNLYDTYQVYYYTYHNGRHHCYFKKKNIGLAVFELTHLLHPII